MSDSDSDSSFFSLIRENELILPKIIIEKPDFENFQNEMDFYRIANKEKLRNITLLPLKHKMFMEEFLEKAETEGGDVQIICSDKTLYAHSSLICFRSEYFRAMLYNDFTEKNKIIRLQEHSSIIFEILRFIYTGDLTITEQNIINLYNAARFYLLDEIIILTDNFIMNSLNTQNAIDLYKILSDFPISNHIKKFILRNILLIKESYPETLTVLTPELALSIFL